MSVQKKKVYKKVRVRGAMRPFKLHEIQLLEAQLASKEQWRDLALLRIAVDTMLRASDVVRIWAREVFDHKDKVLARAEIMMKKTRRPVQVSISPSTQDVIRRWMAVRPPLSGEWLFPGRVPGEHLSEVQYRRIVKAWAKALGLDRRYYSTHSLRRTKAAELYRQTNNLKAVSLLLGHADMNATSRYLGIEQSDALDLADKVRI